MKKQQKNKSDKIRSGAWKKAKNVLRSIIVLLGIVQARALCSKMSNTDQKRSITDQQPALIYYIYKIGDITVKVALCSSSLPCSQPSNQKLLISCCQKQNLQNECQAMLSATVKLLILWISNIFMSNLNYVQETFWKKKQWII